MIYFFDNYASLNLDEYKTVLPVERAARFERFRQTRDKENCLAAYLLLKYALKQNGIEDFKIETAENEKPFLKSEKIFFNISHCKSGVAVAVSDNEVGIDIQDIEPYKESVAKRVCTEKEIELIEKSENKDRAFTRIWTLKEAAAKCDGSGIRILDNFSFENSKNFFQKYNKKFATFEYENLFISVCGNEDFRNITEIKNLEVF